MTRHRVDDLIAIFDRTFGHSHATELVRGDAEPLYLPCDDTRPRAQIVFAHGYFASALHEIAHWCIAGRKRRQLVDFGYWYIPDGRSPAEQQAFTRVEEKPQALEWAFSVACGKIFVFSADNLDGEVLDDTAFRRAVRDRVRHYLDRGFPKRAAIFIDALRAFYGTDPLTPDQFHLREPTSVPIG